VRKYWYWLWSGNFWQMCFSLELHKTHIANSLLSCIPIEIIEESRKAPEEIKPQRKWNRVGHIPRLHWLKYFWPLTSLVTDTCYYNLKVYSAFSKGCILFIFSFTSTLLFPDKFMTHGLVWGRQSGNCLWSPAMSYSDHASERVNRIDTRLSPFFS
jgi:hypothetical protein